MIRVQFNNSKAMYPVNFKTISTGVIENKSSEPTWHASANLGITEIKLYN